MEIWKLYACISFLTNLRLIWWRTSSEPISISMDLTWIPFPVNFMTAGSLATAVLVIRSVVVSAIVTIAAHALWLLAGSFFLARSIHLSRVELLSDNFFSEKGATCMELQDPSNEYEEDNTAYTSTSPAILVHGRIEDIYPPLNEAKGHIRLFRASRKDPDDGSLYLDMFHTALSNDWNDFSALSYCWGESEPDKRIFIRKSRRDYTEVLVRSNLYDALNRMIDRGIETIWVDALCINQSDTAEVEKQVLRMRAIFTAARKVIVWTPSQHYNQQANRKLQINGEVPGDREQRFRMSLSNPDANVIENEYWSRIWIVQEFAFARKVEILTETRLIDERRLQSLIDAFGEKINPRSLELVKNAMAIRRKCQDMDDPKLLDLLLRTTSNSSANRHDRVFGILSLSGDSRRFLLEPSYGVSTEDLCMSMTRFYLQSSGDSRLDVILLGKRCSSTHDWPSWCPDYFCFDKLPSDRRLYEYVCHGLDQAYHLHQKRYCASRDSVCEVSFTDYNILRSSAVILGTIESLGIAYLDGDLDEQASSIDKQSNTFDATPNDTAFALWNLHDTLSSHLDGYASHHAESDWNYGDYPALYFMLKAFQSAGDQIDTTAPSGHPYGRWVVGNQYFRFGSYLLCDHASMLGSQLRQRYFWKWHMSLRETMRASVSHDHVRDWRHLHRPLLRIAEQRMRLSSLKLGGKGVIGLAHASSRVNDLVVLLPGCSVPVVLREIPGSNRVSVVGDAIIPGAMYGEMWNTEKHEIEIL